MKAKQPHPFVITRVLAVIAAAGVVAIQAQAATCTINMGSSQQTIDGFGFSSAWSGQLSAAKNNALYSTLGMSLLRIRIDPNQYWADETANAAAAHAAGVTVLGTSWTPPAGMKDNYNVVGGSLRTDQYGNYASWLNQAANAIGLDYVSFQNEPDIQVNYDSCNWTATQIQTFVQNNCPAIARTIAMPESFNFNDSYSDPVLNNPAAANNCSIVAGHIYGNGLYVHQNAINHGKRVWMTEHYVDNTQADMGNCIKIVKEINDCMNSQFNAYFWWWVADYDSSVNLVNSSGTIFKNGYAIGQFAKWIRPGSTRVSADYNPSSNVYVTAYRVNGVTVIVAVNASGSSVSQQFSIQNGNAAAFEGYRTSSGENMADIGSFGVLGGSFSATLPGQSVTTFVQTSSVVTSSGGAVKLIARHSSKVLDIAGGATANGTQIQQWSYVGGANQQWTINNVGNNQYSIISVASGKCVDISASGTANDTKVQLWDYVGGSNQKYTFTATDSGYQRITPTHATSACLDVSGISTTDGAVVHLWQWLGGNNQQWLLQPVDGTVKLVAKHSGKALEAAGLGTANGTQVQQWSYLSGANQKWTLASLGNNHYSVIGVQSGKSLDISGAGTANDTKVQLWDYVGGSNQKYTFTPTEPGYFRITPTHATGSCLDVSGNSTADGATIHLWQWLNGSNQQWASQAP